MGGGGEERKGICRSYKHRVTRHRRILRTKSYKLTEDAWVTELVADCELWDVLPPSQPERTLVLACPGVDAIQFWPLPVQKPWEEG
jgi:hypothetical protein